MAAGSYDGCEKLLVPLFGAAIEQFGGLDLSSAANEGVGAIDMANVDLDVRGRMRSRSGFNKITSGAAASPFTNLIQLQGADVYLGVTGTKVQQISSGVLGTASSATFGAITNTVPFTGGSGAILAYAPAGVGGGILKWNGSAFSTVAVAFNGGFSANVTPDNRLMICGANTTTGTQDPASIIWFSDADTPETFGVNNFVQLSPGDGEGITGVCNFGNQTFVFKSTKFFVIPPPDTDSGGNPVFNYRIVNTGVGGVGPNCCCAAPDGVYFMSQDGVYRTTGGAPVKVSLALDPLFGVGGPVPPYFQGVTTFGTRLSYFNGRIYVPSAANRQGMLVYDIASQTWMYQAFGANCFCPATTVLNGGLGGLLFAYQGSAVPTATNDVGRLIASATTDAGTAIQSRYRSAFFSFDYKGRTPTRAISGVEKLLRESIVDGTGVVDYGVSNQWQQQIAVNQVTNPGFEVDTTGWATGTIFMAAGGSLSRTTAQHHTGVAALSYTSTGTAGQGAGFVFTSGFTFTAGTTYTASCWVKGNAGGESAQVAMGVNADAGVTAVTLTTSWQLVSVSWTPLVTKAGNLVALGVQSAAAATITLFVDDVQLQQPGVPGSRTLVLGTGTQTANTRDRYAVKGRAFSVQFSSSQAFTVERLQMNLHGYEPTGVKET